MHELNFKCPHCQETIDLTVENPVNMLVMQCHACKTPLMYYHGEVFEVDSIEVGDLQQKHLKAVQGYLKVHDLPLEELGARAGTQPISTQPATHEAGAPLVDHVVDEHDIADLRIDLETTEDVDDFIRRL